MEQVLAPKFNFVPKDTGKSDDYDYGEEGYQPGRTNVGFNEDRGEFQIEIKGLVQPESEEATRICREDLNEVITAFVQDKVALERGLFDRETPPEELTQARMGKIVRDRYPELSATDQEAIRQRAVAAMNLTQEVSRKAAEAALSGGETVRANTALIDGIRNYAVSVTDLDIDLIDRINPFGAAYAILSKSMSEESLKQVHEVIQGKKIALTEEEAMQLAERAKDFLKERGRLPSLTSSDPWERRQAEGVEFLKRLVRAKQNG